MVNGHSSFLFDVDWILLDIACLESCRLERAGIVGGGEGFWLDCRLGRTASLVSDWLYTRS